MAPKNLPPAAKQQKILDFFQQSMNVFTLKELEKTLASVASIHAMQVKEFLQSMQDENVIRVEKIGSGNWYWCFTSDAKKTKENMLNKLKAEESTLTMAIADAEKQIEEEMAKREDEDDNLLEGNGMDRKTLVETHEALEKEMAILDKELAAYSDNDPVEIQRKVEETKRARDSAIRWTDDIESLESYIGTLTTDRAQMVEIMAQACGDEYVLGEGLKDL
ncbi:probable MND1 Mnd1/Hop2 complex promote meiotic chromosome pairing and DSB repair [Rhynchosporium agropyri]|uniref:Meiotic nuclear division protein 1 n=1 Tax=Rhynchosporium agropyri TaxID=914238 RepID=A0A1E1KIV8_9HELO|nr:probable MND1 Mnd1/Hop2 complex promote meiotic chromosome pairing and DSB repair [Rhynchosporium agropyri]